MILFKTINFLNNINNLFNIVYYYIILKLIKKFLLNENLRNNYLIIE